MLDTARDLGVPLAASLGLVWLAGAFMVGGTTFHLAPLLVAGSAAMTGRRSPQAALVGTGLALLLGVILEMAGRLDGPSLLPWGDATLETNLGALAGGIGGLLLTRTGRPST